LDAPLSEGPAAFRELRLEAEQALDSIVDPCSAAAGTSLGLCQMGIAELVDVTAASVRVRLVPTTPTCLFVGIFEEEIRVRLRALDWCDEVTIELAPGDVVWDESRMSPAGRARLHARRRCVGR
jgi:metal-sulfur cluster biosynthetic enzyme